MAKKRKRKAKAARSQKGSSRRVPRPHKKGHKRPSPKARKWISRKVRLLVKEGYRAKQAVAIAMAMARKRGFKVPPAPTSWRSSSFGKSLRKRIREQHRILGLAGQRKESLPERVRHRGHYLYLTYSGLYLPKNWHP